MIIYLVMEEGTYGYEYPRKAFECEEDAKSYVGNRMEFSIVEVWLEGRQ